MQYTQDEVSQAAAEYRSGGLSAFEILLDMANRVPWVDLDTNTFNDAHDEIVRATTAT